MTAKANVAVFLFDAQDSYLGRFQSTIDSAPFRLKSYADKTAYDVLRDVKPECFVGSLAEVERQPV